MARRIWQGRLPGHFVLDSLEDWWRQASESTGTPPDARIFSGPHPLAHQTALETACQNVKGVVIRKSGALLLTVHPSCTGGGVKEENINWSKTKLASLCLSRGVDLRTTTGFVDQIAGQTSSSKLFQALQVGNEEERWHQVADFARGAQIPLPVCTNQVAKAEVRARKLVGRKKQEAKARISAADVQIAQDFFQNEDGTAATILEGIRPGASGVLLTDASRAVDLLHTMKGVQPDELALLVLGHECPDPKAGCTSISFPARGRNCGSQLLLAGCLHNLGGKQITLRQQGNVNVTLPDVLCCTFTVYADECDSERWAAYTQAPVKTVIAAFQGSGVEKVLSEPWGRKFTSKGRNSTPALADVIMFQARVDQKACDALLAHSGHNGVYIVPRRLDQTLVSGYSVVWLGASRAEAIKASLQVPGQLGLVRSKDRYGLRVPESRHDAVFQQLKPGQAVPAKVTVSKLFRMGPVPSGGMGKRLELEC